MGASTSINPVVDSVLDIYSVQIGPFAGRSHKQVARFVDHRGPFIQNSWPARCGEGVKGAGWQGFGCWRWKLQKLVGPAVVLGGWIHSPPDAKEQQTNRMREQQLRAVKALFTYINHLTVVRT